MRVNIPNQITIARLVLAAAFVLVLSLYRTDTDAPARWVLQAGFWIFLVAALTDILDGYLARRWGQVTTFGRIVDPFVDKVLICGAFVLFAGDNFYDPHTARNVTAVAPWMAIVILARELLVSALRAQAEASGRDFSASWSGKLKMFVQSFAVGAVLATLGFDVFAPLTWLATSAVWATVIVTALSIIGYVRRAQDFLFSAAALGQTDAAEPKSSEPDVHE